MDLTKQNIGIFIVLFISIILLCSCSASKGTLKFTDLEYPASMSAFLYDEDNNIVMKGQDLVPVDTFEVKKTFWALAYGLIPLTKEDTIVAQINKIVEDNDADGIINLTVIVEHGVTNKIVSFLMYIPSYIPIVPGSARVTVKGEVVKLVQQTKQTAKMEAYIPKSEIYLALKQYK